MTTMHQMIVPMRLSTEDLLDGVAGHVVEEEGQHQRQEHEEQRFDDDPLILMPQDVAQRLERVQEPHERRVRPAGKQPWLI